MTFFGTLVVLSLDGVQVLHGEDVPALGGHARERVVGTVAETVDAGVIFTAEVRVSLSDRPGVRVL
jgi:hypothetical protein